MYEPVSLEAFVIECLQRGAGFCSGIRHLYQICTDPLPEEEVLLKATLQDVVDEHIKEAFGNPQKVWVTSPRYDEIHFVFQWEEETESFSFKKTDNGFNQLLDIFLRKTGGLILVRYSRLGFENLIRVTTYKLAEEKVEETEVKNHLELLKYLRKVLLEISDWETTMRIIENVILYI